MLGDGVLEGRIPVALLLVVPDTLAKLTDAIFEEVNALLVKLKSLVVDTILEAVTELDVAGPPPPIVELVEAAPRHVPLGQSTTAHVSLFTVLVSRVTLPLNANNPPFELAAVTSVTEAYARMLP